MRRPCVRVDRTAGEAIRRELEAAGLRDHRYAIDSGETAVFIPVVSAEAVPGEYEVVEREVEERDAQTIPEDLLDFPPTYERLGDLVLLQEDDPDRAREAADAIMASDLPVLGVLNRTSKVKGQTRVAGWELLAGDTTETIHREYGAEFLVDPTKAYFSPRLATERERVVSQIREGERVVDMFTGVGPFAVRAALAGAEVVAIDVNPEAVRFCRENVDRNGVDDAVIVIEGDVREVATDYAGWADRIIMNLPHSAAEFLEEAVVLARDRCRLHYYDIQPEDDPYAAGEAAIRAAFEPSHSVWIGDRRIVRSYSPGEVNCCLDADVERRDA